MAEVNFPAAVLDLHTFSTSVMQVVVAVYKKCSLMKLNWWVPRKPCEKLHKISHRQNCLDADEESDAELPLLNEGITVPIFSYNYCRIV